MDHIVSYKPCACVKEMEYYKSTTQKVSDLRRWRLRRKQNGIKDIIIFFADGTIFDTFLKVHNNSFPAINKYWRHFHRLKNQPELTIDTLLAMYMKKFETWSRIIEKNGINSI